jgi:Icc protein
MRIAQISDTHILAKPADAPAGASRAENLRKCVGDINQRGVDAVIHTGDSVQNGLAEEYAQLREILDDLQPPLYLVPGNRDRRAQLRAAFGHLPCLPKDGDFLHYAVEDHPLRLVAIDSITEGDRKGHFCVRRHAWLEEILAREPDKPTILFIHHPPFDVPEHRYTDGYRHPEEAADLTALVGRNPQVKRLLCGHVHALHQQRWDGTFATIMPSVAVDLRIQTGSAVDQEPSYLLHAVSRDGEVVSAVQSAAGR